MLESGDFYICEDGQPTFKIATVDNTQIDLEDIYEEGIDPVANDFMYALSNLEASFECTTRINEEAIMTLLGLRIAVLRACPNKRVVYLADRASKNRTRKKNFHRAVRILERG